MELGFIYDVLYTKAAVIHSPQGWCLRLIIFSFTSIALGLFSVIQKLNYSNIDLILTFLLLAVAILLELYAFLLLLSSDWTDLWLSKHANNSIRGAITCLQLPKQPRWSNSMLQFNLLKSIDTQSVRKYMRTWKNLYSTISKRNSIFSKNIKWCNRYQNLVFLQRRCGTWKV